jgi:hypothetical protein
MGGQPDSDPPPERLYRYFDHFGLDALVNLELKVTPPAEFNDPFELCPSLEQSDAEKKACDCFLEQELEETRIDFGRLSEDQKQVWRDRARNLILTKSADAASKAGLRLLCLSNSAEIITQWAYYADGHRGLALEFDTAVLGQICEHDDFCKWRKVRYNVRKPQPVFQAFCESRRRGGEIHLDLVISNMASEKSVEWQGEQEWRLLVRSSRITSRLGGDKLLYFLPVPKETITRVILGIRSSAHFEHEVRKAAYELGIKESLVVRAEADATRRAVTIPR